MAPTFGIEVTANLSLVKLLNEERGNTNTIVISQHKI